MLPLMDPTTDELKVEIVDLLGRHTTRTNDELVEGTSVRRFEILRPAVRALESDGIITKSGDGWTLASHGAAP
jgi:transcription initiation factor IIE alpha subunit